MQERTLFEIAALCGAELDGDGARRVQGPASLRDAGEREVSFLSNPRYRGELARTRAAGVLVPRDEQRTREDVALLRCADPNAAFTRVVQAFAAPEWRPSGRHASAVVDPSARVANDAALGPNVVVGPDCVVGTRAVLFAGVVLGRGVQVGEDSVLHPGVVLYERVVLGARCTVHAGTVIGSDGFGFEPTREGWRKVSQCGNVVVDDDVEIGANSAIDRGRFGATRIGRGVKIDNLVHIAHNVVVGDGALLIAQSGVAGSTRIGARAILAGQAGVTGHVEVGAGAKVGGGAGVFGDVPAGAEVLGYPARQRRAALRQFALVEKLPELLERLRALERAAGLRGAARPSNSEESDA
ncbi:MAG: UDP-3-O-(3-hydroxymyristoyl)glucosamine N-acyltransferase [Planctomycetes bacterium]|nr:UDP-3-O-(3-hydroxymyristoyl)glucosamine N-acyltransferase [Planctomycetota bacterium]